MPHNGCGQNLIDLRGVSIPRFCRWGESRYTKRAREEAEREGFKRVGLIDGEQLVDILTEAYDRLPEELRERLGLRRTLVVD